MLVRGIFFSLTYVLSSMFPSISQVAGESGGYYFLGKLMSHAEYEPWNWRANTTLQFYFKTWSKSKMMMFYQEEKTHGQHMDLFLIKGKLRLRVKMGQNMVSIQKRFIEDKVDFADSGWHEVKIELSGSEIRFFVNSTDGNVYSADPIPYTEYNPSTTSHQNIESLLIAGLPFRKGFKWTELSYPSIFKEVYGEKPISFQGCIGNIRFNRIPNGRLEQAKLLTSPSEAENNCTGACAERPQRCANGGRCVDYIKYSECDCTGIGYQGGSCEKRSTTVYIKEKGHISYSLGIDSPLRSTERNTLDFLFLTNKATDGVFFYMRGNKDHLLVELVNGRVRAQANVGGDTIEVQSDKGSLNDSCWHFVEVKRRRSRLTLIVDKVRTSGNSSTKKFKELNLNNHSNVIYFGGGPAKKIREKSKSKTLSFNGYLQKFRFEGMDVLENALSNTKGFSGTEVNPIWSSNTNLIDAQMNCKQPDDVSGDCSSDDDDSEICATSTPTPTAKLITTEPETSVPSRDPPGGLKTQATVVAKFRNPTPRPRGVSAWVIIVIVLGAMGIVFIVVFLLYRWNHRYSGSFKPSKNEEGQIQEPGSDSTEQKSRTYNQPAFFVYKPPLKKPTADSPVSI